MLEQYLWPVLGYVDPICLPVTPAIQHTDGVGVYPERNNKRVEHIKGIHGFPEKLKLILVCHILGLNVLVFVGELALRVLGAKMLSHAKELWDGSCGSQVMPIIATQSLSSMFTLGANNLSTCNVLTRAPIGVIKIVAGRSDCATSNDWQDTITSPGIDGDLSESSNGLA